MYVILLYFVPITYRMVQVEENLKKLRLIIECTCILLCGGEKLALRGHRDFGSISVDCEYIFIFFFLNEFVIFRLFYFCLLLLLLKDAFRQGTFWNHT